MDEPVKVENGIGICYGAIKNAIDANSVSQVEFTKTGAAFAEKTINYQDYWFKDATDPNWVGKDFFPDTEQGRRDRANFRNLNKIKNDMMAAKEPHDINRFQTEMGVVNAQVGNKTTQAQRDYGNQADQSDALKSIGTGLFAITDGLKSIMSTTSQIMGKG